MQQRDVAKPATAVFLIAAVLLASACSRLTFIKPNVNRGHYEQIATQVHIDPRSKAHDTAFTMTQVAQSRLMSGDTAGAVSAAERALKADEASADAHSLLALGLDQLGRAAEAGPHYRRAAELAPTHGSLLNNYGIWLCSNGKSGESLDWFERAVAAAGYETPAAALANEASCAVEAGQGDRAESAARRSLEIDPTTPLALTTLAKRAYARGNALEARGFIERRLSAAPADAETLQLASQIEQSLGDTAAAARYVARLRTEFPPNSRPSGDKR
ncbi:type IV pilus biogenesis/stability protein PilW [Cognatilysobacter lacus]|uniref:Type IV pilus biogenesis/stability protein PilW n=1 Tax=Cognatilysobacter lacus TaxID=1643323 RepID=A0A5D8Z8Y4_9GAMM|nr:type IV pilus biogenesis/stability protein PilW [Lysobacter lacus]TZF91395.1 type IV pilus biogenesis/stability protein PilW [Lysobacter lacus]